MQTGKWYEVEVQHTVTLQWRPLLDITVNEPWRATTQKKARDMRGLLRLTKKPARIIRVSSRGREVVDG